MDRDSRRDREGAPRFLRIMAWPVLLGFGVWYFRDEIKKSISRITRVGPTGAEFAPLPQQQPSVDTHPLASAGAAREALIAQIKREIPSDILEPLVQRVKQDARALTHNTDEQIEALAYAVAARDVQLRYEQLYNALFGSQIHLMMVLKGTPDGMPEIVANTAYETAKKNYPDFYQLVSFEQWIEFPIRTDLVKHADGKYLLTSSGNALLDYMFTRRLLWQKPY